jgi:ZIP family zinc transporter
MLTLIAIAVFAATILGGLFALHLKDRLHLVLGFSAGAVLGVVFFDLLPEAFELAGGAYESGTLFTIVALGFVGYLIVDRIFFFHGCSEEEHLHHHRGTLGAGSLSLHSFLDGFGIGLAFQVSVPVGLVVALAVLAHDFSDGINTVNMILKNNGDRKRAFTWLFADAAAPVAGIVAAQFFQVSETHLGLLLALFAGFFLYIGASDLLPESHHAHPVKWTTVMTLLGIVLLYAVIRLAGV